MRANSGDHAGIIMGAAQRACQSFFGPSRRILWTLAGLKNQAGQSLGRGAKSRTVVQ
jgi:hypothetical protein